MAVHEAVPRPFTYDDLQVLPDDLMRHEIIDGEHIVTPSPSTRHQRVSMFLSAELYAFMKQFGGQVLAAPTDVYFSNINVVVPDILFVRADHLDRMETKFIRSAPDLVVEISSPSTRRLELVRKRELYARFGVAEYWYIDLDADRVEVYRLAGGIYPSPELLYAGRRLEAAEIPGLSIGVTEIFEA